MGTRSGTVLCTCHKKEARAEVVDQISKLWFSSKSRSSESEFAELQASRCERGAQQTQEAAATSTAVKVATAATAIKAGATVEAAACRIILIALGALFSSFCVLYALNRCCALR
eukprot:3724731-Amphidinium_carterae.2